MTTRRNQSNSHRDVSLSARRREVLEGLVVLAALILLAAVARLPAG